MAKTVTVIVKADGTKTVSLDGFQGIGCTAVMKAFTAGDKVTKEIHKPEYHLKQVQQGRQ